MAETVAEIVVAVLTLALGYLALSQPHRVQRYLLSFYDRHPKLPKPWLGYVRSSSYISMLRMAGVVFIAFALLVFTVLIFGAQQQPVR